MPRTVPPPGRLIRLLAYLVPASVLPSAIWRLTLLAGFHIQDPALTKEVQADRGYIIFLSAASLSLALLSLGLVRPWGLVFPRWVPHVAGREVPARLAVGAGAFGALGGLAVTAFLVLVPWLHVIKPKGATPGPLPFHGKELLLLQVCYAPLCLTGALLAVVTWDYALRRRAGAARAKADKAP